MEFGLFVKGVMIGLTLAVPVGPIALICIRRTMVHGRLHGIVSGMGVASGDTFYGAIALLGITAISSFIIAHPSVFQLLASVALIIIGISIWQSEPHEPGIGPEQETYFKDYLSVLGITLANPMTIIFFLTVFPGITAVTGDNAARAGVAFVSGIFCGSATWWVSLSFVLGPVRPRPNSSCLVIVNRISGGGGADSHVPVQPFFWSSWWPGTGQDNLLHPYKVAGFSEKTPGRE